jgi:5-dehydro-4-deoxyglucarate dehydratase
MSLTPSQLAAGLDGLLAFPVTPFTQAGEVDLEAFRRHLTDLLAAQPGALFVCCGTGEFASLTQAEHADLVRAAAEHVNGAVPILAGAGGGTRVAAEYARAAEDAGADGLLVLPPYLQVGPPAGLVRHYTEIAAATRLGIIPYQRSTAVFSPEAVVEVAAIDNVVAFKDGHGDIELLQRIQVATGGSLPLLNGMPTAEMFARAYEGAGAHAYSSAVLAFAPEIATTFHRAHTSGDEETQDRLLREFYSPLVELRNTTPGYAVALVKAGLEVRGRSAGPVRPPFVDPSPAHRERLASLIDRGLAALEAAPVT